MMKYRKRLDGHAIDLVSLNILLYGKADPDSVEATPEMEAAKPKFKSLGKPVFVGTAGDMEKSGGRSFFNMWKLSESFGSKDRSDGKV